MTEIILAAAFFALACAALVLLGRICASLARLEAAADRLAAKLDARTVRPEPDRADAEQERYARGVANILAYGTRELMRRGGEAQ